MSNVLVSVIIVAAGTKQYLKACIGSLKKQTYPDMEIVVIDNSLDGDFAGEFVRQYPEIKFYHSPKNLFYCEALNKGISLCAGDFILCLNDDVELTEDFVRKALEGFNAGERTGMVSGKILRSDSRTIDSTGLFLSFFRSAKERGYGRKDTGVFEKKGYVFGVNGAVAFYRRKMLEQIKLGGEYFDSDFGFFYEDLDIAWRAQNFGWKAFYVPAAIAYHIRGATARSQEGINKRFARRFLDDELHYNLIKNRYLAIIKNESLSGFLLHLPFIAAYDLFAWGYVLFFRPRLIKKFLAKHLPVASAFKKRKLLSQLTLK